MLFICDEWKSTKGGLSTFNRCFAENVTKYCRHIDVSSYVQQSDESDRENARKKGVSLLTAAKLPGNRNQMDWLKCLPEELPNPDVVVAHGRKFGQAAHFIVRRASSTCCWVQMVHVFCQDIGKYKTRSSKGDDPIDENENKHQDEVELCEAADAVVTVGTRLWEKYSKCLHETTVVRAITPGILEDYPLYEPPQERLLLSDEDRVFDVVMVGRAQLEDRTLKGYDVIAKAVSLLGRKVHLTFVGSERNKQTELEKWFLRKTDIEKEQLTVCRYSDREILIRKLKSSDLFVLPSREDAFGMAALEALSSGIPILVSQSCGIADVLRKVENGASFIVSSNDPVDWAKRIRDVSIQRPRDRYDAARRLREDYSKTYPWEQTCQEFANLLEEVIKSKGSDIKEKPCSHSVNPGRSTQRVPLKRKAMNMSDEGDDQSPTNL